MSNWQGLLADLYDHLEEHDLRLQLLRAIDRQILARSGESLSLVVDTVERLVRLTDARSGYLFHAYEGEQYRFLATVGDSSGHSTPIPDISAASLPLFGDLQRTDKSSFASWLPKDSKSFVVFEIGLEDHSWGIAIFESPRPLQSSNDFIESVLSQISIALRDLRVRARLQRYQEIHGLFFSTDLDQNECLKILRDHVRHILSGHDKLLMQILFRADTDIGLDRNGGEENHLVIRWSTNEGEIGALVPFDSFSGRALEYGAPFLMADPTSEDYAGVYKAFSDFAARTELVIPIRKDSGSDPLGVLNIESPREHAFSSMEIENLLDLVALVSPILVAVRHRILMAHHNQEASLYAINSYLRNVADLYGHKFASRTEAIKFNIHAVKSVTRSHLGDDITEALEHLGSDFAWLEESLQHLWGDISSVAGMAPIYIHTLLEEIQTEEKASATRYLKIKSARLNNLPPVRASRLLKEHLRNLILNSVVSLDHKFIEVENFQGAIEVDSEEITIRQTEKRAKRGSDPVAELNRRVRISIRDNGQGISRENLDRVFLPGFSTHGTQGFGLPAARDFVRGFGGNLKLESVKGEYCQVWLELPVYSLPPTA